MTDATAQHAARSLVQTTTDVKLSVLLAWHALAVHAALRRTAVAQRRRRLVQAGTWSGSTLMLKLPQTLLAIRKLSALRFKLLSKLVSSWPAAATVFAIAEPWPHFLQTRQRLNSIDNLQPVHRSPCHQMKTSREAATR